MKGATSLGESDLLDTLLIALAGQLGSPLSLDGDSQCTLLFDQDVEIVIAAAAPDADEAATELVTLRSRLSSAGGTEPERRLRRALALNYGSLPPGLAVALDEASNQIVLLAQLSLAATGAPEFVSVVAMMVAVVPQVREMLGKDARPVAAAPAAEDLRFNSFQGIRG
jgi:Tir chaperone protein (CesT) family